jgi:hypothetical protein
VHTLSLLGARCERPPGRGAANNLHEITPSHCRPRSKTTLFGIQLPSSEQKIASSETGLKAQCALQKSRAAHVSDGSRATKLKNEHNESAFGLIATKKEH